VIEINKELSDKQKTMMTNAAQDIRTCIENIVERTIFNNKILTAFVSYIGHLVVTRN